MSFIQKPNKDPEFVFTQQLFLNQMRLKFSNDDKMIEIYSTDDKDDFDNEAENLIKRKDNVDINEDAIDDDGKEHDEIDGQGDGEGEGEGEGANNNHEQENKTAGGEIIPSNSPNKSKGSKKVTLSQSENSYAKSLYISSELNPDLAKQFNDLYINCLKMHNIFLSVQPYTEFRHCSSYLWLYLFFEIIEFYEFDKSIYDAFNKKNLDQKTIGQICKDNIDILMSRGPIDLDHLKDLLNIWTVKWKTFDLKHYYIFLTIIMFWVKFDVLKLSQIMANDSQSLNLQIDIEMIELLFEFLPDLTESEFRKYLSNIFLGKGVKFSYNFTCILKNTLFQDIKIKVSDKFKQYLNDKIIFDDDIKAKMKIIRKNKIIDKFFDKDLIKEGESLEEHFHLLFNFFEESKLKIDEEDIEYDYDKYFKSIAELSTSLNFCCADIVFTYVEPGKSNIDIPEQNINSNDFIDIDNITYQNDFFLSNENYQNTTFDEKKTKNFPIFFENDPICKIFNYNEYNKSIVRIINQIYLNNIELCNAMDDETVKNVRENLDFADGIRFSHSEITFLYYFLLDLDYISLRLRQYLLSNKINKILSIGLNLYSTRIPCQRCTVNLGEGWNFVADDIINKLNKNDNDENFIDANPARGTFKIIVGYSEKEKPFDPLKNVKSFKFNHRLSFLSTPISIMQKKVFEDCIPRFDEIEARTIFMNTKFLIDKEVSRDTQTLFYQKLINAIEKWEDLLSSPTQEIK